MLYDFDTEIIADNLIPEVKKKPKYIAWVYALLYPIQKIWELLFRDYKNGSTYNLYSSLTTYNFGDRVIHTNKSVYEATYLDANGVAQSFNGFDPTNTVFWTLVNDNFIGAEERLKYTSQIILLEYALNRWYMVDNTSDQIYIENVLNRNTAFVMGDSGQYSSAMANNSNAQNYYLGNAYTYPLTDYDYIIWIPNDLWLTLGSDDVNRYNNVRSFVNKYNLSGIRYKIVNYY